MSDETTLLPCPFCGGEAKVMQADHPSYTPHSEGWYVICGKCRATLGYHGTDELYMTYGDFASELGAIEAWNARAMHSTLTAEQVEKAISDCSTYASYDGCTYYASGIRLQAIADELNAELGGTCELREASWDNGTCTWGVICSACGAKHEHTRGCGWNYAPCCGKMVKR